MCDKEKIKCEFNTDVYGFSFSFVRNITNNYIVDEVLSNNINRSEITVQIVTNSLV